MYKLNDKIKDLTPYEPISGTYKIRLDANESYLRIPEYISAEIVAKLFKTELNRYPDSAAASLCAAFAKYWGIDKGNVVAGNGSDELISVIMNGFLMKGESFATLQNDFSMYDFYGSLSECNGIKIPKNADFTVDIDLVIDTCKNSEIKLLIFSNPCNPTSLGIEPEDVKRIITSLPSTLIVLDEAYMDFWGETLILEVNEYDNLLILKTCSKAFGLAGLRVGFAVGNTTLIRAIKAIKSPYNVNTVSQIMAETVLLHKGEVRAALKQIISSKDELYYMLKSLETEFPQKIEIVLGKTNFIVIKTAMAQDIWKHFLNIGIAVRCFDGFLRITTGANNENLQVVKFLRSYLKENQV